jgi:hypothetical protein
MNAGMLLGMHCTRQRITRASLATIAFLFQPISPKLPNKPLKRDYPTFFSSLSSHSLMPASCSISASWCSHQRRSYVFQCIPFGFSGNGFVMLALPPRRSRIVCARRRARCISFSRWLS